MVYLDRMYIIITKRRALWDDEYKPRAKVKTNHMAFSNYTLN